MRNIFWKPRATNRPLSSCFRATKVIPGVCHGGEWDRRYGAVQFKKPGLTIWPWLVPENSSESFGRTYNPIQSAYPPPQMFLPTCTYFKPTDIQSGPLPALTPNCHDFHCFCHLKIFEFSLLPGPYFKRTFSAPHHHQHLFVLQFHTAQRLLRPCSVLLATISGNDFGFSIL